MKAYAVVLLAVLLVACGDEDTFKLTSMLTNTVPDPGSTKFADLRKVGTLICGRANTKNQLGAYVGYTPFIADTKTGQFEFAPADGDGLFGGESGVKAVAARSVFNRRFYKCAT